MSLNCNPWKINSSKKIGAWGLGFLAWSSSIQHAWHLALLVAQICLTGTPRASPETHRVFGTVLGGLNVKSNG